MTDGCAIKGRRVAVLCGVYVPSRGGMNSFDMVRLDLEQAYLGVSMADMAICTIESQKGVTFNPGAIREVVCVRYGPCGLLADNLSRACFVVVAAFTSRLGLKGAECCYMQDRTPKFGLKIEVNYGQ